MALFLEVLDGEQKGTRIEIRDGLIIGRRDGDLTIRDSKISSQHARVEMMADGGFRLIDLGSSNAIKSSSGRVRELSLEPGTIFTLGRTPIQVLTDEIRPDDRTRLAESTESRLREIELSTPANQSPDSLQAADPDPDFSLEDAIDFGFEDSKTKPWKKTVLELLRRGISESKFVKKDIAAFTPPLRLKFIRGIQYGSEWIVGYGPRMVGSEAADLLLEDLDLPSLCFRLVPQHEGALFQNVGNSEVLLNGKQIQSELLRDGDVIEIKSTQIQVFFDSDLER